MFALVYIQNPVIIVCVDTIINDIKCIFEAKYFSPKDHTER